MAKQGTPSTKSVESAEDLIVEHAPPLEVIDGAAEGPPPLDHDLESLAQQLKARVAAWEAAVAKHHEAGHEHAEGESCQFILPEELPRDLELLQQLNTAVAERPTQLFSIEEYAGIDLFDWVSDVIFTAAESSSNATQVLAIFDAIESIARQHGEEDLCGNRALLLLTLDRKDEALLEAEQALAKDPSDLDKMGILVQVYQGVGDLHAAERMGRKYLKAAAEHGEPLDEMTALEFLIEVLQARGKKLEIAKLEARIAEIFTEQAARYRGDEDEDDEEDSELSEEEEDEPFDVTAPFFAGESAATSSNAPIVRSAPKVGRNEPCPCGSGQKYKRCCGKGEES